MLMKVATAGMAICSLVIIGIVIAGQKKNTSASATKPGADARETGSGASAYTGPVPRQIAWEHDLHTAITSAEDGNRVVVVDVYTSWCGWCKRMDQDIYSDPQVAALGREAVFLKLNAEDNGEGQRFAREARVRGYPTTIILDSRGRQLQQQAGYFSPAAAFIQWVHSAHPQAGS